MMFAKRTGLCAMAALLLFTLVACSTPTASSSVDTPSATSSSVASPPVSTPPVVSSSDASLPVSDTAPQPETFNSKMYSGPPSFQLAATTCAIMLSYSFEPPAGMQPLPDEDGLYAARYVTPDYPQDSSIINVIEMPYTPELFELTEEAYLELMAGTVQTLHGEAATFTLDSFGQLSLGGYPALAGICTINTPDGSLKQIQCFIDAPISINVTCIDATSNAVWTKAFGAAVNSFQFDVIHTVGVGNVSFLLAGLWKAVPGEGREQYLMPGQIGFLDTFSLGATDNLETEEAIRARLEAEMASVVQIHQEMMNSGYTIQEALFTPTDTGGMLDFGFFAPEITSADQDRYQYTFRIILNKGEMQVLEFVYPSLQQPEAQQYIQDVYSTLKMASLVVAG
ncbi:MAG: hypothetical protein GXY32_09580 [Ruminococcaceae bacterium]|nr:hypothetical protein [Oscillospiraceae bacterium]